MSWTPFSSEAGSRRRRPFMTSFNLSRWAVGHRALVLFLILATSVAGLTAFLKLGRAEDPNFTIKVGIVTAVWPGATAREMQDQVADLDREEAAGAPLFREGRRPTRSRASRPCRSPSGTTRRRPGAEPVLPDAQEDRRRPADLPPGVAASAVNDEYGDVDSILYMLTGTRRRLRATEARGGRPAPAPAQGRRGGQGRPLRRAGPADLRRVQPRQARHARRRRRRRCSTRWPAERGRAGRHVETGAQRVPLRVTRRPRWRARGGGRRRSRPVAAPSGSATSPP